MNVVIQLLDLGYSFSWGGDRLRYTHPGPPPDPAQVRPLLAELKAQKFKAIRFLQERTAAAPAWIEPDQLYLACQRSRYPKRVIWPDGERTYHNGDEFYADLWSRSMTKEAQRLGGSV